MDCPLPATIYKRKPEQRGCYLGGGDNKDSGDRVKGKARDTQKRTRWALGDGRRAVAGAGAQRAGIQRRYEGRGREELDLRDGREGSIVQMRHGRGGA